MPNVQLFFGDANDAEARLYASLAREGLSADAHLSGELVGPFCRYSDTLPARIRFSDRGPGPTLLAEAVVPHPCFWTPELPFMYRVTVRLSNTSGALTTIANERPFGIRRLGVQGTSIYLDAKRFVLRGIQLDSPNVGDLKAAREAASALYLDDPNDVILEEASEEGVLLAVRLGDNTAEEKLIAEVARVGRWPAVAVVVLDGDVPACKDLQRAARNTLLAQRVTSGELSATSLRPWADLLWWEVSRVEAAIVCPSHNLPLIVYRPAAEAATIAERRLNCDRLQAELAPLGDFAGYFT